MRRTLLIAACAGLLAVPPAFADFVIRQAASPPPITTEPNSERPANDQSPAIGNESGYAGQVPDSSASSVFHWKMANGFGNQVPLSFACRQIVPPAVRVTYGRGASPDMLVNWRGGDTWNRVLRDAVKPLGLHLAMTYMAVEISE
jgi:hypothetical protein